MNKYIVLVGAVILVGIAAVWITMDARVVQAPGDGVVCTMDVERCPDGSYVGRTGPECRFEECPAPAGGPVSLTARLNQEVSGLDVSITPLLVLEDSRCPVDVQCIQAGTVRVRARLVSGLGTAMQEFKLGEPITTEAETVTLTEVLPAPSAGVSIAGSEYTFRFEVAKR